MTRRVLISPNRSEVCREFDVRDVLLVLISVFRTGLSVKGVVACCVRFDSHSVDL